MTSLTHVGLAGQLLKLPPLEEKSIFRSLTAGPLPNSQLSQFPPGHAKSSQTESRSLPKLEVRKSPGKGFGLFAVDQIPAFTGFLVDDALLSLANGEDLYQLWERYLLLPMELRTVFDQLGCPAQQVEKEAALIAKLKQRGRPHEQAEEMARVSSRFQGNAFKTGVPENGSTHLQPFQNPLHHNQAWKYALFPTVARINHSCTPNSHVYYSLASGAQVVYSLRQIDAGEEIEIAYFDLTMPLDDRQSRAQDWGFSCTCPACTKNGPCEDQRYETHLALVHRDIFGHFPAIADGRDELDKVLVSIEQSITFAKDENLSWLRAALPGLFGNLGMILKYLDRPQNEVKRALQTSWEWQCKITGPSSPQSLQSLRTMENCR